LVTSKISPNLLSSAIIGTMAGHWEGGLKNLQSLFA
jgi:hypothetical protein